MHTIILHEEKLVYIICANSCNMFPTSNDWNVKFPNYYTQQLLWCGDFFDWEWKCSIWTGKSLRRRSTMLCAFRAHSAGIYFGVKQFETVNASKMLCELKIEFKTRFHFAQLHCVFYSAVGKKLNFDWIKYIV